MIDLYAVERALLEAGCDETDRRVETVGAEVQYEEGAGDRSISTMVQVTVYEAGQMDVTRTRRLAGAERRVVIGGALVTTVSGESVDTTTFETSVESVSDVLAVLQFVKRGGDRGTGTVSAGRSRGNLTPYPSPRGRGENGRAVSVATGQG